MKWNWIFLLLFCIGCQNIEQPKFEYATSRILERPPSENNEEEEEMPIAMTVAMVEELPVAKVEGKEDGPLDTAAVIIDYDSEYYEDADPNVESFVEHVPVAPEGEFIVEPPIDTSEYGSLDEYYKKAFEGRDEYLTDGFDYPVGKPDMRGYYIAQKYLQNRHLGDDFNANSGGNTDLGDPVYATANGIITFAYDLEGGWGNTVRIVHRHPVGDMVESLYSHLDEIHVSFGQYVKRGDQIGTIGTAHGLYPAHLHFEMRTQVNMPLGKGYTDHKSPPGYTAPTPFIRNNRPQKPRW